MPLCRGPKPPYGGLVVLFLVGRASVPASFSPSQAELGKAHLSRQEKCRTAALGGSRAGEGAGATFSKGGQGGLNSGTGFQPVGTVYIALAMLEEVEVWHFLFHGNREAIKILSAETALDRLRRKLKGS